MSVRRIKKGLGRRPMSEKRRQFLELLARGRSLRGACIERGIARSTSNIWTNGTRARRTGGTVNVVPPLELRRNRHPTGQYRPFHAHAAAAARRRRCRPFKLVVEAELRGFVIARLRQR